MKAVVGSFFPVPEWTEWGWKYSFTTNVDVPQEKWPEIIKAVEAVMNDVQLYKFHERFNTPPGKSE